MNFMQQRHDYFDALGWVSSLMCSTVSVDLDGTTPCDEFDVRQLIGHLIGTAQRGLATAERAPTHDAPHIVSTVPDDDLAATYADLANQIQSAWLLLDETDRVTAPWGVCAALEAARGFTIETITHGWDLAIAIGQPSDVCADAAQRCLSFVGDVVPARLRGVMYDEPAQADATASATEHLAAILGRQIAPTTAPG